MVKILSTKSGIIFFLAFWLSLAWVPNIHAQSVKEYTDADSLSVGDIFDFSITLNRDQKYDQVIFPDTSEFRSAIEMRSRSQFKVSSYKDSVYYQLQFFATADTIIPALPVRLVRGRDTTTIYTTPVPIGFKSVLAKNEKSFRPLKPIYDFAAAWWPYILAFILLGIAAYYLYPYFMKEEEPESREQPRFTPTPFTNPLQELQDDIAKLEQAEPKTQGEFKEFYIALGDAIRRYFEDLHQIPALESTSREILQKLKARSIDQNLVADTKAVLEEADMVKFAKFTPSNDQAKHALLKAHDFIDRANEIDGPRVEHLQREHQSRVDTQRKQFEQRQNKEEVHA